MESKIDSKHAQCKTKHITAFSTGFIKNCWRQPITGDGIMQRDLWDKIVKEAKASGNWLIMIERSPDDKLYATVETPYEDVQSADSALEREIARAVFPRSKPLQRA